MEQKESMFLHALRSLQFSSKFNQETQCFFKANILLEYIENWAQHNNKKHLRLNTLTNFNIWSTSHNIITAIPK